MHAAPRAVLHDFHKMVGRITLQKLPVIGEFRQLVVFDTLQRVRQRHFTKAMMVTITFPIRSDMRKLWPSSSVGKAADQTIRKPLAVIQQAFKGHALRYRPVVEKDADRFFRRQVDEVSATRIDAVAGDVFPASPAFASHTLRLARRHYG